MFAPGIAWQQAAVAALRADSTTSACAIYDGPVPDYADIAGLDLVIVGWDDADEDAVTMAWSGGWRDTGMDAVHSGEVAIPVTIVSQSGADMTASARLTAADTLTAAVLGVLIPSPVGSALGVPDVMWAQDTEATLQQIPTDAGPIARVVLRITVACLASTAYIPPN